MQFKHSRLRITWSVCQILSMAAMLVSMAIVMSFFFNQASPSGNHVLRLAGAFGMLIVPFVVRELSLKALFRLATAIGIVRRAAIVRVIRQTHTGSEMTPRMRCIGNWLGGIAVANFVVFAGLGQYVTTYPEVETKIAGKYYWSNHGHSHEVPKLLYDIGSIQGPSMIITHVLAMGFFGSISMTNWYRKRNQHCKSLAERESVPRPSAANEDLFRELK